MEMIVHIYETQCAIVYKRAELIAQIKQIEFQRDHIFLPEQCET